jgi:hypothetical protein
MWRTDPLLAVILWWTAIVAGILVWLPLMRGVTQGGEYQWALSDHVGGRGVGGAYWLLLLAAVFVLTLLYLGWRGAPQPFHWLLLAFHVPLAVTVTYAAWSDPQRFRFEGATIGVDVSLAAIGPILFCSAAAAAIAWVVRDVRTRQPRDLAPWAWTRAARVRAVLLLALVPVEVVLFRSGAIESTQNLIGVGFVGWQWVLVNRILAGARS